MKKRRLAKLLVSVLLAVTLLASTAFAIPNSVRQGSYLTPQVMYEQAEYLAYYVCVLHINSGYNDNPLLLTYQKIMDTDEVLSANQLRRALIKYFSADEANYDAFLDAMLDRYDPYTNLFTQEEYASAYPDNEDYVGIGFVYRPYGPFLIVDSVYADSPAGKAGVQAGDKIVKIAGSDIRTLTEDELSDLMNRSRGTDFSFSVLRDGEEGLIEFRVSPGEVVVPFIEYDILDSQVGYLAINRFEGDAFDSDLSTAIAAFRDANVTSLVIDLRDNPGGGVTQLLTALNAFVPEKDTLLFTELHRGQRTPHVSLGGGYDPGEIFILVNGNSASSSEIFCGVLSDLGIATTVGTETYGKGRGQSGYNFGSDILMISSSEVELPVTGRYDGHGLTPDIFVEDAEIVIDISGLAPLGTKYAIKVTSDPADILALEQRLALMGYLFETPDEVFDTATIAALADVYAALGQQASKTASVKLLAALSEMVERMDGAYSYTDAALAAALNIILGNADTDAAA
ncbi:MAG: S41 family peptidase [Clostridiaceae bacterium]|nr:S41 family peptidase [Clostridiaceae bacterium]